MKEKKFKRINNKAGKAIVVIMVVTGILTFYVNKDIVNQKYFIIVYWFLVIGFFAAFEEFKSAKSIKKAQKSSLIYKQKEQRKVTVEIKEEDNKIILDFWSDCGKFGTDEPLDFYKLTPERLLSILQERNDYSEDEI